MCRLASTALYDLARPLLFAFDAERTHDLTLEALQRAYDIGATRLCRTALDDDPVQVMGLQFPNRVGLAAGLDKDGAHIDALGCLGFGFIEVGTVTPRPQPGNPKPRLFRLPKAQALINRLGFNNAGVSQFVTNVRRSHYAGVLGLNIGKNATTPIASALDDYRACLDAVYPYAGYVTINISSPNTKDLRNLQGEEELGQLLAALQAERERLGQSYGRRVPLAVKIAPDLEPEQIMRIADTLVANHIDAVIATNTTIARDAVAGLPHSMETGGLSGRPLRQLSTQVVQQLSEHLQGALPIIAVGGILEAADAVEKVRAGASLVQLYTGLIYRGPVLVHECRQALAQLRKAPHP
ncbi:MAG TPA: quinone-dependent dihydroorotate dehydrogenase [Burkholderiaceae bacterium]|nr:quinone-dependent dihydroorotate dehydrogenase [Burkholderiaceae bacterium]